MKQAFTLKIESDLVIIYEIFSLCKNSRPNIEYYKSGKLWSIHPKTAINECLKLLRLNI